MQNQAVRFRLALCFSVILTGCQSDESPISHPATGEQANEVVVTANGRTVTRTFAPPVIVSVPTQLSVKGAGTSAPRLTLTVAQTGKTIECSYRSGAGGVAERESCSVPLSDENLVEVASAELDPGGQVKVDARLDVKRPSRRPRPDNAKDIVRWHKNPGEGTPYPSTPFPGGISMEFRAQAASVARANPKVHDLLGKRSAFVGLYSIDAPKDVAQTPERHYDLVFFSHSNNRAVSVEMLELEIKAATFSDIWPGSGDEEDQRALELMRADPRLPEGARNWDGGAMLASLEPERNPAPGHRLIDVRMGPALNRMPSTAEYFAIVDLTEDKVLELGKTSDQRTMRKSK